MTWDRVAGTIKVTPDRKWENSTRTEHSIYVIIPLSWELKFILNEVLSEGSTVIVYEQRMLLWHPLNIQQLVYKRLTKICLVGTVQLGSLLIISLMAATVLFICCVVLMTTWILSWFLVSLGCHLYFSCRL